jgi:hypothetical protein
MDAWAESNANAANQLDRKEQGGYIIRDRITGQVSVLRLPAGANCGIAQQLPIPGLDLSRYQLQGSFHTHPYHVIGEVIPKCKDPITGTVTNNNPSKVSGPGASLDDELALQALNAWLAANNQPPVSEYVMNKQFVSRLGPDGSDASLVNWLSCPNSY